MTLTRQFNVVYLLKMLYIAGDTLQDGGTCNLSIEQAMNDIELSPAVKVNQPYKSVYL